MHKLVLIAFISSSAFATLAPPPEAVLEQKNLEATALRFTVEARTSRMRSAPPVTTAAPKTVPNSKRVGDHLVFDSQEAAEAWARERAESSKNGFRAKKFIVTHGHEYQPIIQKYIDDVWRGYKALFKDQTRGLDSPPVVIIESEVSNAYVDGDDGYVAHAVFVLTGLVDTVKSVHNKDGLLGILAHELGHSVFLHGMPDVSRRIQRFYERKGHGLGFEAGRNSDLDLVMAEYLDAARSVGDLAYPELLNLPSPGAGGPYMSVVWRNLRAELAEANAACQEEKQEMGRWNDKVSFNGLRYKHWVADNELPALAKIGDDLIRKQQHCFAKREVSITDVFAKSLRVEKSDLEQNAEFIKFKEIYDKSPDPVSGLQAMVQSERETMQRIEAMPAYKNLGYYTTEQHADDASALALKYVNENPAVFNVLLNISMNEVNPKGDDPKICRENIEKGLIPDMGSLFVIHHSYCHRVYNFLRLSNRIVQAGDLQKLADKFLRDTGVVE